LKSRPKRGGRGVNLRRKMALAFLILVITPLFALGAESYALTQRLIERKFGEQSELTLRAIGRNIRYVFKEANYFSDFWMVKEPIQTLYRMLDRGQADPSAWPEYENTLRQTLLTYAPIQSVTLYGMNGLTVRAGREFLPTVPYDRLVRHPFYQEVLRRDGVPKWIGPGELPELTGDARFFDQVRVVKDFYTMDNRGVLWVRFYFNEFDKIFQSYKVGGSQVYRFLIVGANGLVLYDSRHELEGRTAVELLGKLAPDGVRSASGKAPFLGTESVVASEPLGLEPFGADRWSIVAIAPWSYVSGEANRMIRTMATAAAACLVLAFVFNYVFVHRLVLFILKVVSSMRRVEHGDLTARIRARGNDETTALAVGFNRLVERVSELLDEVRRQEERKKEAELMLMQAQIKPHFLFNTLESINVLAVQNRGREVGQMVQRLGALLRASIRPEEEVEVRQEIEHLRNYLEIQSFRFTDRFDYEIDVPEDLMECLMPKLTLQPLAENALHHGLDGLGRKGRLRVWARLEPCGLAFYVEDDGRGIPAERLAVCSTDGRTGSGTGIGLRNVADRIRLRYGPRYGVFVCSREGEGTTVKCVLPPTRRPDPRCG